MDGTLIANDSAELRDGSILAAINLIQDLDPTTVNFVWTGTPANGVGLDLTVFGNNTFAALGGDPTPLILLLMLQYPIQASLSLSRLFVPGHRPRCSQAYVVRRVHRIGSLPTITLI